LARTLLLLVLGTLLVPPPAHDLHPQLLLLPQLLLPMQQQAGLF
jgi:hypothetical protein